LGMQTPIPKRPAYPGRRWTACLRSTCAVHETATLAGAPHLAHHDVLRLRFVERRVDSPNG
jgi:hypothetical protein